MYKIKIGENSYSVEVKNDALVLNGKPVKFDLQEIGADRYNLILDNSSYNVEIVSYLPTEKLARLKVNNRTINVGIMTEMDGLLSKMGLNNHNKVSIKDIGAPMPGLILDINVKEGDVVKKGDKLMVLEAMKMENIIKSPGDGKIKSVKVTRGESVDSGQKLIFFE